MISSLRRKPHITVLGSVNLDFIVKTKTLPKAGETIMNGVFETLPGGKGANVAMVAKRLGAEVALQACVGDDIYADAALETVRIEGVDLSNVIRLEQESTGVAFINVSEGGENQIAVASGANVKFRKEHLETTKTDAIISQFEIPADIILEFMRQTDAFKCLNASPVGPALLPFLPLLDLIIVNEGEYKAYEDDLTDYKGLLAITLGASGAKIIKNGDVIADSSPPSVHVVDSTGAGDSFAAALTLGLVEGKAIEEALDFAVTVGALATTKLGTQSAAPYRNQVEKILYKNSI